MAQSTDQSNKRPFALEPELCIVCQKENNQKLMTVSSAGIQSLEEIRQLLSKLPSDNFRDATDRFTDILQVNSPQQMYWHKDCRSSYMSKLKVERLRKASLGKMDQQCSSTSALNENLQNVVLRSKTPKMNWRQCMFCQKDNKESLHLIQEMKVSSRILEAAKYENFLRAQLACVNDLTAADGRYH